MESLAYAFPEGFISPRGEFIAHASGDCFDIKSCKSELDFKCKVLEFFSRSAYKSEPFDSVEENEALHIYMLKGINRFLGTNFDENDIEMIYTYLGNAIKHYKTIEFITKAKFNMDFFSQFE